jgi:4-amino-4-deoxy-L-arabinose transferase-like glycosyltransferase
MNLKKDKVIRLFWRYDQWIAIALIVAVMVIGSVLRFVFLDADFDPDLSGSNSRIADEGWKAANGLKKTLTGEWLCEERNWISTLPVAPIIQWIVFEVFGISLKAARAPSVVFSIITIVAAVFLLLSGHSWRRGAIWSALLLVILLNTNYSYFGFSRMAFYEIPMISFGMLSLVSIDYLLKRYEERERWIVYAELSCILLIFSILSKTTGVIFVLAIGFTVLLEAYSEKRIDWKKVILIIGIGTIAVVVSFIAPKFIAGIIGQKSEFGVDRIADARGGTIRAYYYYRFWANRVFVKSALIHLASLFGCLLTLIQSERKQKIRRADAFMLALYLSIFIFQGAFKYQPPRYSLPFVIPMCYFAALLPWKVGLEVEHLTERRIVGFVATTAAVLLLYIGNATNVAKIESYLNKTTFTQVKAAREIREIVIKDSGSESTPLAGDIPTTFVLENRMFFHFGNHKKIKKRPLYMVVQERRKSKSKYMVELGVWDIVKPHWHRRIRLYKRIREVYPRLLKRRKSNRP